VPSFDGGDDFIWVGFPDEWFRFVVVFFDETVDGGLQVYDGMKDAVLQASACQLCEEAFDSVQPGT
tara:strand:+ start:4160 stop:4357 length:198 start_codon:yes stop_codon:yes gene_type:complete